MDDDSLETGCKRSASPLKSSLKLKSPVVNELFDSSSPNILFLKCLPIEISLLPAGTLDPSVKKDESVTYSRWDPDFDWNTFYGGHYYKDKHEYYVRHFQNERQNDVRMLERILFTQMYLEKHNIEYKMMCYRGHIIMHDKDTMSNGQRALYNKIDWSKFIFYKDFGGLEEFTKDIWPDEYRKGDLHPLPRAHYHWVKDVMFKSDIKCPEEEYRKINVWKTGNLK